MEVALDLKRLRFFVEIADSGALSHAAQVLNVSQSSLSHHIAEMEADLGVVLLERRPRGVALTAAGQRLYEQARDVLQTVRSMETDIRRFSDEAGGRVSVGLPDTAALHVALKFMTDLRSAAPRIALSITEAHSARLADRVLKGEVDCALIFDCPEDSRLETTILLEEDLYVVAIPELIGDPETSVSLKNLPDHPILICNPECSARMILDHHAARALIGEHDILTIDSLAAMRAALEGGLGFGVVARSSVSEALAAGRLVARKILEAGLTRQLALVSLRSRPKTRAAELVCAILSASVREAVESGRWPARIASPAIDPSDTLFLKYLLVPGAPIGHQ